jgi:hypothetical protein
MPVLLVALMLILSIFACNLAPTAPTPTPFPTPLPQGDVSGGPIIVVGTPAPGAGTPIIVVGTPGPTPLIIVGTLPPGGRVVTPTTSTTTANWLVDNVLVPAFNFLYTLFMQSVGVLWSFAGLQGGVFTQFLCCIVPGILVVVLAVRSVFFGRRRWF